MARYAGAAWHGPVPNQGGPRGTATNRIVVHIMEGSIESADAWFHNPQAQVSAHFGVAKDGRVFQWVDTSMTAWAQAAYNSTSVSIEHEGYAGTPLTPVQLARTLLLQEWILQVHASIPRQFSMNPRRNGIIGHGQLGYSGGNHPGCPGMPILRQMAAAYRPAGWMMR